MLSKSTLTLPLNADDILAPFLIEIASRALDNFKMEATVRPARLAAQSHTGFFGSAVALLDVAADASSHQIFPSITAATGAGNHVVEGKLFAAIVAVLAGVSVPFQDVAAGEWNFFVRNPDIMPQADDSREGKVPIEIVTVVFQLLSFSFEQQDNRPSPTGNVERFVGGV